MSMLEIHNGKERELGEWMQLFEGVDKRFKLHGVKQPVASRLGILEFVWNPVQGES